jgi:hypothetical protein
VNSSDLQHSDRRGKPITIAEARRDGHAEKLRFTFNFEDSSVVSGPARRKEMIATSCPAASTNDRRGAIRIRTASRLFKS